MPVFELRPTSTPEGSFVAAWFDNEACLWNDERLGSSAALAAEWQPPTLRLHRPAGGATPVLFNPNALAVSQGVRDELAAHGEIEFLPVHIENHGMFYILHVTAALELPAGSKARMAPAPSRNIVQIEAFPRSFEPPYAFFRVLQPVGAAARYLAATTKSTYLSASGARAIASSARAYLVAREVTGA
jgi:hypothetical protein